MGETDKERIAKLEKLKETLTEDLAVALNGLRFYGNRQNWQVTKHKNEIDKTTFFTSDIAQDNGTRARITVDTLLKVRRHKAEVEKARSAYDDTRLSLMGYQLIPTAEGFLVAKQPDKVGELFKFAGIGLNFTIDISSIKPFETDKLARIAVSTFINREAVHRKGGHNVNDKT